MDFQQYIKWPNLLKFKQHIPFALLQFPKSGGFVAFVHTVWRTCLLIGEEETDGEQCPHPVMRKELFHNMETIEKEKQKTNRALNRRHPNDGHSASLFVETEGGQTYMTAS